MRFEPEQIEETPTKGRRSDLLYRRVWLEDLSYDGAVRYDPALEEVVEDVREYIAEELNRMAVKLLYRGVCARLWSPVEIPMPA